VLSSNTEDPSECILTVHKHLVANSVFSKSIPLFSAVRQNPTVPKPKVIAINKLDQVLTQAMLLAEIRCRRKPRPAWSAALAAASSTVRFWKTLINGLLTKTDVSTTLQEISKAQKWDFIPTTTDLDEAKTALKTAFKGLTTCRKTATELRKSFLDDRIAAAAIAEDTTVLPKTI
jgi:hypothetical protein